VPCGMTQSPATSGVVCAAVAMDQTTGISTQSLGPMSVASYLAEKSRASDRRRGLVSGKTVEQILASELLPENRDKSSTSRLDAPSEEIVAAGADNGNARKSRRQLGILHHQITTASACAACSV